MHRSALRATIRPRFKPRPLRRHFHVTPQSRATEYGLFADSLSSVSYSFHNAFQHVNEFAVQYVHDSSALSWLISNPWLVSIPLTTFMLRFSLTPLRYYINRRRRDQRLATPELELAARLAQMQTDAKVAAKQMTVEESAKWKHNTFLKWRNRIMERHPGAAPSSLFNKDDNADVTNILTSTLTTINFSTLLALHYNDPLLFGLDGIETFGSPLSFCFLLLAWHNSNYYCGHPAKQWAQAHKFHPVTWSPIGSNILVAALPPMAVAGFFVHGPGAVLLFLLSNSIYTFAEIKMINRLLGMPPVVDQYVRHTEQTTRSQRHKRTID